MTTKPVGPHPVKLSEEPPRPEGSIYDGLWAVVRHHVNANPGLDGLRDVKRAVLAIQRSLNSKNSVRRIPGVTWTLEDASGMHLEHEPESKLVRAALEAEPTAELVAQAETWDLPPEELPLLDRLKQRARLGGQIVNRGEIV